MSTTSPLTSPRPPVTTIPATTPTTSSISSLLNRPNSTTSTNRDNLKNENTPPMSRTGNDTLSISTNSIDGAAWPAHLPTPVSPAAPQVSSAQQQQSSIPVVAAPPPHHSTSPQHSPQPHYQQLQQQHQEEQRQQSQDNTYRVGNNTYTVGSSKHTHDGGLYTSFSVNKQNTKRRDNSHQSKPFTCTQCDQTFSRAHNLKSHFATHSMERPYKVYIYMFTFTYISPEKTKKLKKREKVCERGIVAWLPFISLFLFAFRFERSVKTKEEQGDCLLWLL